MPKLQRYYEESVTTRPDVEHKMLKVEDLWPEFRGMSGGPPDLATPGKIQTRYLGYDSRKCKLR